MGAQQPYMYEAAQYGDARFPTTTFDPKAVTRASYAPKPEKPKQEGPLVSVNRHPDAHEVLGQRRPYHVVGHRTKQWIKGLRKFQLFLRLLELIGATGVLVLMILISHVATVTAWIMRITAGVVMVHSAYAVIHLSRHAGGRTPGSSAAYHLFAGVSDLAALPLYAFGALAAHRQGGGWHTVLADQTLLDYFVPAFYYTLIGAGGLHVVSLGTSLWLGAKFRQIALMPPDMNPLEEERFTSRARQHKRNKSSVATTASSASESESRLSTPLEHHRRSGVPYEDVSRHPTVPFMQTRAGASRDSLLSKRDSRHDLPSRRYQVVPGNASPRSSVGSSSELKRMSTPSLAPSPSGAGRKARPSWLSSYAELPLHEPDEDGSRPSTGTVESRVTISTPEKTPRPRAAKFSEAWYASESLVSRTQERSRALAALEAANKPRAYEVISQRYDDDDDDQDEGDENRNENMAPSSGDEYVYDDGGADAAAAHPNPLRSNPPPAAPGPATPRSKTPFRPSALSEVSLNDRRVSGEDIADAGRRRGGQTPKLDIAKGRQLLGAPAGKRSTWGGAAAPRNRDSSIQRDDTFYAKPYGELKPATPPIMLDAGAGAGASAGRQVSSGNDYDLGNGRFAAYARRNVSGKMAEEGRSRYSVLND